MLTAQGLSALSYCMGFFLDEPKNLWNHFEGTGKKICLEA